MRFGRMKNSMYKKMIIQLFLCHMLLISAFVCAKGVQLTRIAATPAFRIWDEAEKEEGRTKTDRIFGLLKRASSGQRVVPYSVMEKHYVVELSQADYEALLKIVQAEAGNEDETGKMMVAGVVLNRVKNEKFPDTVSEVVTQKENGCYRKRCGEAIWKRRKQDLRTGSCKPGNTDRMSFVMVWRKAL